IKSVAREKAKVTRVKFVLSHVSRKGGIRMVVDDMYDWVHVDEEWFYVMRDGARIHLRLDVEVPNPPRFPRKHFISKLMFLMAVARSRQLSNRAWFDGKIGIWPVIKTVKAKHGGKNRAAGDMENQTRHHGRGTVQANDDKGSEVTPAIKARMPGASTSTIWVQQDSDQLRMPGMGSWGKHTGSPATNSPDLNVLDLGFFHSIQ
ncbi:unnamed protein product, partial [Discosporangium mesarthrocarpum]